MVCVCVALCRHYISTASKHDAAVLTESQDVLKTLLKEIRCYIGAILVKVRTPHTSQP